MARKRRARQERPTVLTSLTEEQARWLRAGRDTPGGVYIPITADEVPYALAGTGAAEIREVPRSGGTRGPRDPRPCEWVDRYLIPTEIGLALLRVHR